MTAASNKTSEKTRKQPDVRSVRGEQETARNHLYFVLSITTALALACVIGMLDRSIRTDPFTATPSLWQWFAKPQPHPALATIPVLPMGAPGILSWRPRTTNWLMDVGNTTDSIIDLGKEASTGRESVQKSSNEKKTKTTFNPPLAGQPELGSVGLLAPLAWRNTASQIWAACEPGGAICLRLHARDHLEYSKDGGLQWLAFGNLSQSAAPRIQTLLFENEKVLRLASDRSGGETRATIRGIIEDAGKFFLDMKSDVESDWQVTDRLLEPFVAAMHSLPQEPLQILRRSDVDTHLLEAFKDYLQDSRLDARVAFAGIMPTESGSRFFALAGAGTLVRSEWTHNSGEASQVQHKTDIIPVNSKVNLRSMHFQPDKKIGWVSSGWDDGNEEGPYPAIFQTRDGGSTWKHLSYRHRYAPWILYIAMPGLVFAFFAAGASWVDYRESTLQEGISEVGTSDTPIGWNDPDILGLKPLALALSRFVRNSNTIPPLSIAVTGPWGTGKSSLLNLVAEDLCQRGASPVWFNAWHHQKEEHILAALLENIRAQAVPSAWRLSGLLFRTRLFARRAGVNFIALALAVFVVAVAFDLSQLSAAASRWFGTVTTFDAAAAAEWIEKAMGVGAGALLLLLVKVYSTLKLNPSELMATLRGNAKLADFKAQLGFRYRFAQQFDAAGHALRSRTNPGLVIFIDDLDRCSPANLLEVLKSVNFLTTAGPCFIFLGMDEPRVVEIIAKQLGYDKERAQQYLKKLINLTVQVPEVDASQSIGLSIGLDPIGTPPSPWLGRIRNVLRNLPDLAVPMLLLVAVIGLGTTQWLTAPMEPTPQDRRPTVSGPAPTDPKQSGSASTSSSPSTDQKDIVVKIPTVSDRQLMDAKLAWSYIGVGFTFIIILLLLARRMTTTKQDQVDDSANFRTAMRIWHPVVFASDPTPRGVKRHQNRLRLQAMRLRPTREKPSIFDRWLLGESDDTALGSEGPIPEIDLGGAGRN